MNNERTLRYPIQAIPFGAREGSQTIPQAGMLGVCIQSRIEHQTRAALSFLANETSGKGVEFNYRFC